MPCATSFTASSACFDGVMPDSLYTSIEVAMSGARRATHLRAIIIRIVLSILLSYHKLFSSSSLVGKNLKPLISLPNKYPLPSLKMTFTFMVYSLILTILPLSGLPSNKNHTSSPMLYFAFIICKNVYILCCLLPRYAPIFFRRFLMCRAFISQTFYPIS